MKKSELHIRVRSTMAGVAVLLSVSGCASQHFAMTKDARLSPEAMQHLVLRPKYAEALAIRIPGKTRDRYEAAFLAVTNEEVRVVRPDAEPESDASRYYLNTEVTKYKPGSPVLRMLMTPVIAFGLWGSYVDVAYSISDASTDATLGNGVVRKSNLWGGSLGGSITSESQLESCPKAILGELNAFMKN